MPTIPSQKALRSADFIQSLGVVTHLTATQTAFGNTTQLIQDLAYLNIDHVKDRIIQVPFLSPFLILGQAGIKFDLIIQGDPNDMTDALHVMAPYIVTLEGPNEVDRSPITYKGVTGPSAAVALQKDIYAFVHNDPILNGGGKTTPVLVFSVAPGANYSLYGDLSAYADYKNIHAYGQQGAAPHWFIGPGLTRATDVVGKPAIITETGNYTMLDHNGVNELVQAKLAMDTLLDAFLQGVVTTYYYELTDITNDPGNTDHEDHWGLFHADGTPKISAFAIHNLTTVLADASSTAQSFTPAPLTYSVTGLNGFQFAMQKSNGVYDIALWREPWIWDYVNNKEAIFSSNTITLTFAHAYHTINLYDPLVGTAPVKTYHDVSAVDVSLNTSALVLEILPDSMGQLISTGAAGGVFASTGADTVVAGSGAATVNASGAATITGSTGSLAVTLTGSSASVTGAAGDLTVVSNSGNNTIAGGTGAFSYTDFGGNDLVTTGTSASNRVALGTGSDTVSVRGVATVTGSTGAATITLNGSGASVTGGAGAITIVDQGGSNTVTGGSGTFNYTDVDGNDLVTTGTSASNTVALGVGNDTVNVLGAASVTGGSGAATIILNGSGATVAGGAGTLAVTDKGGSNVILGGSGALALTLGAAVGGDLITTANTSGTSTLVLGNGSDTVVANGATSINANKASFAVNGSGNLSVNGGTGSMTVDGGAGSDYVFTQNGTHNVIFLGSGKDTVLSHGADTITASAAAGANTASIYAGASVSVTGGAGLLSVNGQGAAITVTGGTGAVNATTHGSGSYLKGGSNGGNVLLVAAGGGNSTLVGAGAGDKLSDAGTAGLNLLTAGAGGATLTAGSGNDTLAGGSGADTFVLVKAATPHSTLIQNFTAGVDHLGFTGFGSTAPIASQQVVGGNLQLTLADQSLVTLTGVTSLG